MIYTPKPPNPKLGPKPEAALHSVGSHGILYPETQASNSLVCVLGLLTESGGAKAKVDASILRNKGLGPRGGGEGGGVVYHDVFIHPA